MMRINIKDIIDAVGCTEDKANNIEEYINNFNLLDWSECEMSELREAALEAHKALSDGYSLGHYVAGHQ